MFSRNLNETCEGIGGGGEEQRMGEKEGVGELGAEIARERKGRRGKRKKGGDEKTFHERRRDFSWIKQATAWLIARHPGHTSIHPPSFATRGFRRR